MKKYLLIGTGIALLGGGAALAQMSPHDMDHGGMDHGGMDRGGMDRGGMDRDGMDRDGMDRGGMDRGGMDRMDGPGSRGPGMMPPHEWEMMHGRHHGGGEAASFRFKRGDMEIGIKCSEREPTQVCVNAASMLLDKLNNAPTPTPTPPAPPKMP